MGSIWRQVGSISHLIGSTWHLVGPSWCPDGFMRCQYSRMCAQVGPKMDEAAPHMAQNRTNIAPGELKLATSWPRDCMKADISHTYVKLTNSFGKPMIWCIPHAQFACKVSQEDDRRKNKHFTYLKYNDGRFVDAKCPRLII